MIDLLSLWWSGKEQDQGQAYLLGDITQNIRRQDVTPGTLHSSAGTLLGTQAVYTWSEDNLLLRVDRPDIGYSDYLYDVGGDRIRG
jgi:hypothetical protein